jgi:hypothetical protein
MLSMHKLGPSLLVIAGLLVPACSAKSPSKLSPDGPGSGALAVGDYLAMLTAASCTNQVTCGDAPDQATCIAANHDDNTATIARVMYGTIKFDAAAAPACLDQIANAACTFDGFQVDGADPCAGVLTGTVAAGGACFDSLECASPVAVCTPNDPNCDPSMTCCPSKCIEPMIAKSGAACDGTATLCDTGLYCAGTQGGAAMGTCQPVLTTEGAACTDPCACANPRYCNLDDTGNGKCVTPAASKAACSPNDQVPCVDNRDYCDPTTKTCTARVAVGTKCDDMTGAQCVGYAACFNSACVAYPGAGAACNADTGIGCLGELACTSGTCQAPPPAMDCGRPGARVVGGSTGPRSTIVPHVVRRTAR